MRVRDTIQVNLVEDSSYDHSALGDFRDRLGKERWKKLFFMILKQIEDAGFSKGDQYVDATHLTGKSCRIYSLWEC